MNDRDNKATWLHARQMLQQSDKVLLCCHERMDGDAMCATVAVGLLLEGMGVPFEFGYYGELPGRIPLIHREFNLNRFRRQPPDLTNVDVLVVLDTAEIKLLGKAEDLFHQLQAGGVPIINVDHHPTNQMFGDLNIVDPETSAVCELLFHLFKDTGMPISADMAHCLLWGILKDTVMLKVSSVTPGTLRAVASLVDLGADRVRLVEEMPTVASVSTARIWGQVLASIETTGNEGRIVYAIVDRDVAGSAKRSELRGIASFMRDIGDVTVAVLFLPQADQEIEVSFRSKSSVDASKIAESLGGGGHRGSSGCLIKGKPLEEAVHLVLESVRSAVEAGEKGGRGPAFDVPEK